MNKTIRRSVIITLVFVFATVSVFGAMGGFKPLKDGGYVKVYNGGELSTRAAT